MGKDFLCSYELNRGKQSRRDGGNQLHNYSITPTLEMHDEKQDNENDGDFVLRDA